jgi:uncharacterized protein (TIGR01777 family)
MIALITGAQGFVGSRLTDSLLGQGHQVIGLGRSADASRFHENYTYISADTTEAGEWTAALRDVDVVINLAGKSIFTRWSTKAKQQIYDSRILTTRNLVDHLPSNKPMTLLSASGVGFYGNRNGDELTEDEPSGSDFLAKMSVDWEAEAQRAVAKGARVACMRFGIILGADGGALATMIPTFRRLVGGRIGSGRQWFPWLHIDDLVGAAHYLLDSSDFSGPANFCSPNPVTNNQLTRTLASVLGRPAILPAPAFMMRVVLGEFAEVLLGSQRALPGRLVQSGFQFKYTELRSALEAILAQSDHP